MGIGKKQLPKPLTVYNADGSENKQGKITHYCWLRIVFQRKQRLQKFFIAVLGKDSMILGYPFLYLFDPKLHWKEGRIEGGPVGIQTPRYKYRLREIGRIQKEALRQLHQPDKGEAIYMR